MNVPQREKDRESAFARMPEARRRAVAGRPRWGALAGSVLAGVVVGTWLWSGGSPNSLGEDVLLHVAAEATVLAAVDIPTDAAVLGQVLERAGIRLGPQAGTVFHAQSCRFRGHTVAHVVVRTDAGPVTLLVMREEPVEVEARFAGNGLSGRIVASGPGSLAVVAAAGSDLEPTAARMQAAVEWLR